MSSLPAAMDDATASTHAPRPAGGERPTARLLGLAALALTGAVAAASRTRGRTPPAPAARQRPAPAESRHLHGAAALLAASVLADSSLEHYRGSFENPGMAAPLIASTLALAAGVQGAVGRSRAAASGRCGGAYGLAVAVGAAGTAFHVYNVARRPGGFGWLNLFYAAPLGAPAALSLAGLLGLAAGSIALQHDEAPPTLLGLPAGRMLAALTGAGLLGTVGEAGLLHFRGAFQNPFMWLPVTLPPVAAALLVRAAASGGGTTAAAVQAPARASGGRLAKGWLGLTAALGIGGIGFHARGVSRSMGGWRNWSQNLLAGPPLPAPPSFSALAWAGLAALSLIDRESTAREEPVVSLPRTAR